MNGAYKRWIAAVLAAALLAGLAACRAKPEDAETTGAETTAAKETETAAATTEAEAGTAEAGTEAPTTPAETTAEPTETTAEATTGEAPAPETEKPAQANAAGRYYLDSEQGGYSLELNAGEGMPLQAESFEAEGLPAMRLTATETGKTLEFHVAQPQNESILNGLREQAIQNGGREISLGYYKGYTAPTDGQAVLLLEKAPGSDAYYTLRLRTADAAGIENVLADAAIAGFLSTAVFNVNF